MEILSFFKKLFSSTDEQRESFIGSPKEITFSEKVSLDSLPFRFFLLVNAEYAMEKWDFSTIKKHLQDYFLSCPESMAFELTNYSHALVDYLSEFAPEEREAEWSLIFRHFHSLFSNCTKEQQMTLYRECLPAAYMYQSTSSQSVLGEMFINRITTLEKFSKLSNQEIREVFDEARKVAGISN
jgi:hypothetical protein